MSEKNALKEFFVVAVALTTKDNVEKISTLVKNQGVNIDSNFNILQNDVSRDQLQNIFQGLSAISATLKIGARNAFRKCGVDIQCHTNRYSLKSSFLRIFCI